MLIAATEAAPEHPCVLDGDQRGAAIANGRRHTAARTSALVPEQQRVDELLNFMRMKWRAYVLNLRLTT
jgi:hypothetical protein